MRDEDKNRLVKMRDSIVVLEVLITAGLLINIESIGVKLGGPSFIEPFGVIVQAIGVMIFLSLPLGYLINQDILKFWRWVLKEDSDSRDD